MPAPLNRTLRLDPAEQDYYRSFCHTLSPGQARFSPADLEPGGKLASGLFWGDALAVMPLLPDGCVDLAIIDPPYNLTKDFHGHSFAEVGQTEYLHYIQTWLAAVARLVRPGGSVYICAEWRGSAAVHLAASEHFTVRNRITWEREKGRGSSRNWKNSSEDIWFCTKGDEYYFDLEPVKVRRRVRAPYHDDQGQARDWSADDDTGSKWRDTCPSNLWTDLTVPFWSMPENTDHPTQKPEKLAAKLVLASSRPGDLVFDPFAGSGTSLVAAQKLGRRWLGIEQHALYAALAMKRLELAAADITIQGYEQGVFWERNSAPRPKKR